MKHLSIAGYVFFSMLSAQIISCNEKKNIPSIDAINALQLKIGEAVFCGSTEKLGSVAFDVSGSEKVKKDFNLAISFLHSFDDCARRGILESDSRNDFDGLDRRGAFGSRTSSLIEKNRLRSGITRDGRQHLLHF